MTLATVEKGVMVHVFHQIPFVMPSGMLQMNMFVSIYERETRAVWL